MAGLRTAFDTVDRKVLSEAMRAKGIREDLVKRVEGILEEKKE